MAHRRRRNWRINIKSEQSPDAADSDAVISSSNVVREELARLSEEFVVAVEQNFQRLPIVPHDPQWPSRCVVESFDSQHDAWRPIVRETPSALSGLENALEESFPEEFQTFFTTQWSASIPVVWVDRPFELLQLWNEDDEQNLMHNLLGHALQKRRTRESLTLFFALIDDARFLSVDTSSGEIVLEEVGGGPAQVVSPSLSSLLPELKAVAEIGTD